MSMSIEDGISIEESESQVPVPRSRNGDGNGDGVAEIHGERSPINGGAPESPLWMRIMRFVLFMVMMIVFFGVIIGRWKAHNPDLSQKEQCPPSASAWNEALIALNSVILLASFVFGIWLCRVVVNRNAADANKLSLCQCGTRKTILDACTFSIAASAELMYRIYALCLASVFVDQDSLPVWHHAIALTLLIVLVAAMFVLHFLYQREKDDLLARGGFVWFVRMCVSALLAVTVVVVLSSVFEFESMDLQCLTRGKKPELATAHGVVEIVADAAIVIVRLRVIVALLMPLRASEEMQNLHMMTKLRHFALSTIGLALIFGLLVAGSFAGGAVLTTVSDLVANIFVVVFLMLLWWFAAEYGASMSCAVGSHLLPVRDAGHGAEWSFITSATLILLIASGTGRIIVASEYEPLVCRNAKQLSNDASHLTVASTVANCCAIVFTWLFLMAFKSDFVVNQMPNPKDRKFSSSLLLTAACLHFALAFAQVRFVFDAEIAAQALWSTTTTTATTMMPTTTTTTTTTTTLSLGGSTTTVLVSASSPPSDPNSQYNTLTLTQALVAAGVVLHFLFGVLLGIRAKFG